MTTTTLESELDAGPSRSNAQAGIKTLMTRFWPYLLRSKWLALTTAGLALASPLAAGALLWSVKHLIDDVLVGHLLGLLPVLTAIYVGLVGVKLALSYAIERLEAGLVERIGQDARVELYKHVVSLSPGSHGRSSGDLLAHLTSDVERVQYLIYSGPLSVLADGFSVLFFSAFLFLLSWKLTLAAMLVLPLLALISWRMAPHVRRAARIARHKSAAWMSHAEERLDATPLIHAFGTRHREARAFAAMCDRSRQAELVTVGIQARTTLLIEAVAALGGLAVIALGAVEIGNGHLTVGTVIAFIGSVGSLYGPASGLAKAAGRFQRAAAGAQRVADLLDTPSLVQEQPAAKSLPRVRGAIEFDAVEFAYPGRSNSGHDAKILDGVSFRVEPGESVALVGASGAGKSTLLRLMLRLCDPTAGRILLDGRDLRDVTLASLCDNVVPVFQDSHILRGTVAQNIRYGEEFRAGGRTSQLDPGQLHPGEATMARRMAEVARVVRADEFIDSLPGGYEAQVGSHGGRLSGGQRQRLALGRALMRDAPVLLFDEATASIDSETEELIADAIGRLAGERTILLVAHRLSSILRADRVIVLDRGRIVETGAPRQLMASDSRCRRLFAAQIEQAQTEPGKLNA